METTALHIKNMVCPRCIKVVSEELTKLGHSIIQIQLGKVELEGQLSDSSKNIIAQTLSHNGFELLDDKKTQLIEKIKILIIEGIRDGIFAELTINLSDYLSEKTSIEYSHLSHLFSAVEGKSIERFVILQKIERIKELISYQELSIKEIAYQLGYSSLQALSNQFKKETGLTPSEFKKATDSSERKPISEI